MKNSGIFRKVSLDRLSSPEQLDRVMYVTSPRGWIALSGLGLLLAAALAWGIFGRVADKVAGQGILVRSGGVLEVVAPAPGRISDISVAVGDSVHEGQVVAWVAQPSLFDGLQRARNKLDAQRESYREELAYSERDARLQHLSLERQRRNLQSTIAATEKSLAWLRNRIEAQDELVRSGLVTQTQLLATQQQHNETDARLRESRSQLLQLDQVELEENSRRENRLRMSQLAVEEAELSVAQLKRELESATQITSPYTGRILELMVEPGQIVNWGEPVLSLDLTGKAIQNLVAVVYVPAVHGKMVHPGMRIQIAPSTVRSEEYGMVLGRITFVSDYPATSRGMARVLKNPQLVTQLSGGGAPYEVHANLLVDPNTPSRYRWSSSTGPPIAIESGTLAGALITVQEERPISLVVPMLRKWMGL